MISTQIGFAMQLKGKLTHNYNQATNIFVDHC
jgi:hypothetical protein